VSMLRFFTALLLLLATAPLGFGQSPPAGCTTTTCTGQALPGGYLTVNGTQLVDGQGNNDRVAAVTFSGSPGDGSMNAIRNAGFNTVRIPWRDKSLTLGGGLPTGCDTQAHLDTCIANAAQANLKVILYHLGNEIPAGGSASACWGRQQNGLWFDSGTGTNNTDGCGDTGTVTYANFKTNTTNLMAHYAGNSTVIGYEFHYEPIVATAAVSTNFNVVNGQIIDPNGNRFLARGFTINDSDIASTPLSVIQSFFPRTNYVRVSNLPEGGYATMPAISTFVPWVNSLTAVGIVVQFSNYTPVNSTGCDNSAAARTWYTNLATTFKNNPYVWIESQNSCGDPTNAQVGQNHTMVYNAVRGAGNNNLILLNVQCGDSNTTLGLSQSNYSTMANVAWDVHFYGWAFSNTTTQADSDALGKVFVGYFTVFNSSNGSIPVIIGESGNAAATTTTPDVNGTQTITTAQNISGVAGGSQGFAYFEWNNPLTSAGVDDFMNAPSPWSVGTAFGYGTFVQSAIAAGAGSGPTPPNASLIGVNWGDGGNNDLQFACNDVGAAVSAVNPGVILFCPGAINNTTTLLNGQPLTSGAGTMDLTCVTTNPVGGITGLPANKVAYVVHEYPSNVRGVVPDSGATAITRWNTFWGYIIAGNIAPVLVLETGCSCDNSNGSQVDDLAFMNSFVPYLAGTAAGGITYANGKQPTSNGWYAWGNLNGNPNGTLSADNTTLRVGQQGFWSQLLFGSAVTPPTLTVWNPSDKSTSITLSNNNKTATSTAINTSASVRATTAKTTGNVCFEVTVTTIQPDTDVGIANGTYNLAGIGLGGDVNGIGFDPNSGGGLQGIFFSNNLLSSGGVSSANGTHLTECFNLDTSRAWVTSDEMRAAGHPWNNDVIGNQNPATLTGGMSFSGLTCPCFITYNEFENGGVVVLNTAGPFAVATPSGFSSWDAAAVGGRAQTVFLQ
jgi:hypothetical protein